MKRTLIYLSLLVFQVLTAGAQVLEMTDEGGGRMTPDGRMNQRSGTDSLSNKEIPKGLKVWTIDSRFGDREVAEVDTMHHLFMNSIFDTGLYGQYNTTGNIGSPRINRIFIDRPEAEQFMFTQPYDYFLTPVDDFHFTNTLSPITNVSFNECGDKQVGENHLKALFAVNAGKKLGVGFKFDYIYGRGYFQNQSTAHFNYTMYGSYLGDRYQAHVLMATNHQKVTENGGITDDRYVSHPDIFEEDFRNDEIPTVLNKNWNRNDNQQLFFTHRYSLGFNRKVKMTPDEIKAKQFAMESQKEQEKKKAQREAMRRGESIDEAAGSNAQAFTGRPDDAKIAGIEPTDTTKTDGGERIAVNGSAAMDSLMAVKTKPAADTAWMKNEFVPVTSFIHTLNFVNHRRIYEAYDTPANYYLNTFLDNERLSGDSIYDKMKHYELKNTFAVSLLEGFNKWAKAGLRAFVESELNHFTLPDTCAAGFRSFNEHNLSIGAQLSKTEGKLLHYDATAETWIAGEDAGQIKIDGSADLNFRFLKDTVQLSAKAFACRLNPTFYYHHFQSKHLWWDNEDLDKEYWTHIEGSFAYEKTRTRLRIAADNIKNLAYFAQQYTVTDDFYRTGNSISVNQCADNISLFTVQLSQDFTLGPLNWENQITYQKSGNNAVLPVPDLNVYSNLYLNFKIAKVLSVHLGADVRYFTKYFAPDYSPVLGQFCVQDNGEQNVELGNYPIVNVYANMHLKHTRFFVMMSHVNAGDGGNRFLTPHYPVNGRVLRVGLSWNFFN